MSGSTHSADTSTGGGWIDMSRGAMQQALEALEQDNPAGRTATIAALRAALA